VVDAMRVAPLAERAPPVAASPDPGHATPISPELYPGAADAEVRSLGKERSRVPLKLS